jgi:hypothetical protein
MRDPGLFFRKLQAASRQEVSHRGTNPSSQEFLRNSGHSKIICISHDMDLARASRALRWGHTRKYRLFKTVQGHVRKHWRNYSASRGASCGCEQGVHLDIPGLKPSAKNHLVHRYIAKQPFVADVVETTADVAP